VRFNVEPLGKAGMWGITALVISAPAFAVLVGIRSGSFAGVAYSAFHWLLLAAFTFPLLLAPLPFWVVAVRFFPRFERLERERALFLPTIRVVAAVGIAARTVALEWPTMRLHPRSMLNGYYAIEWLAFWCGLAIPRLFTQDLRLGAFLPFRRRLEQVVPR
jgi:hypothetical protein